MVMIITQEAIMMTMEMEAMLIMMTLTVGCSSCLLDHLPEGLLSLEKYISIFPSGVLN